MTPVVPHFTTSSWKVSPATPADIGFILDSWANDACIHDSRIAKEDPDIFKVGQRERIIGLVQRNNVITARPTDAFWQTQGLVPNPHELFGYICYGSDRKTLRPVIHFIYVKAAYRQHRIADTLLKLVGVRPDKACWTTSQRSRLLKPADARGITYNRFLLDYDPGATPAKGSWKYP
jgi:hypothetical protein